MTVVQGCAVVLRFISLCFVYRPDMVIDSVDHGFIMEVEAAEIVEGTTFDSGWTLRFPRAVKPIRYDKRWSDAMTIEDLHVRQNMLICL